MIFPTSHLVCFSSPDPCWAHPPSPCPPAGRRWEVGVGVTGCPWPCLTHPLDRLGRGQAIRLAGIGKEGRLD